MVRTGPGSGGRRLSLGALAVGLALVVGGSVSVAPADPAQPLYAEVPLVDRAATHQWLAAGAVPSVPELGRSTMVRDALRDLHVLSAPYGVPVAGWSAQWRYVWPRDSALVAVAFARTGHSADAERVLAFLQQVQPVPGFFQARYLPDGSGAPDDRGVQADGVGWALWALSEVVAKLPPDQRPGLIATYRPLLDRSTAAAQTAIDNRWSLPPASPDYWEVSEWRPTLATAALLRAGLVGATALYRAAGDEPAARTSAAAAQRLTHAIGTGFGPHYPRRLGGRASSVDLGVDFLLPPFAPTADPEAVRAWRGAPSFLARPAGGLAPGGSWRRDGLSWTTATSTYALTAAALGDRAEAVRWLTWLSEHRTADGSLPEKVTATGEPAAAAPLAWAAAAVVIAADELQR